MKTLLFIGGIGMQEVLLIALVYCCSLAVRKFRNSAVAM